MPIVKSKFLPLIADRIKKDFDQWLEEEEEIMDRYKKFATWLYEHMRVEHPDQMFIPVVVILPKMEELGIIEVRLVPEEDAGLEEEA